jgi:signal transduction histidine kinase
MVRAMTSPIVKDHTKEDHLDKVSWELLVTYEALSTIYNSANLLATSDGIRQAAGITLSCAIEITESTGGVILIPGESDWQAIENKATSEALTDWVLREAADHMDRAQYDEGPFEHLHALSGKPVQSCLWSPFNVEDDNEGILYLFSTEDKEYSSVDIKLVGTLCCQGALAVRCFIHLDELREKNVRLERALEDLTQAQDDLVKSERLSALGQMASMIVHDIKNPMGGLLGYAQLLATMAESLSPDEVKEYAGIIIKEMRRLSDMTEEIMDFSRGMATDLNHREVTPRDLVAVAAPVIESEMELHEIAFKWDEADDETVLTADTDKMERVFINLAINARQAMQDGGTFTIASARIGDWVEFSVRDTGKGIPEEFKCKVFEPFETRKKGKGLGIGLAVARWVVEAHGGEIWLDSSCDEGSEFKIRLPLPQVGDG